VSTNIPKTIPRGRGLKLLTNIIKHTNNMLEREKLPARWITDISVIDENPPPKGIVAIIRLKFEYKNHSIYEIAISDTDLATTILTTSLLWGEEKTPHHLFTYFLCATVNLLAITKLQAKHFNLLSIMNYAGGAGASASFTFPSNERGFLFTYFFNKRFTHIVGRYHHYSNRQYLSSNTEKPCRDIFDVHVIDDENLTEIHSAVDAITNLLKQKRQKKKQDTNIRLPPSALLFPQRLTNLILPPINKHLMDWGLPQLTVDPTLYFYPRWWGEIEDSDPLWGATSRLGIKIHWGENYHHAPRLYVPLVGGKISITVPITPQQSITKTLSITTTTLPHIDLKILTTILLLSFLEYIQKRGNEKQTFIAGNTPSAIFLTDHALPINESTWGVGTHIHIYTDSSRTQQALGSITFALTSPSTLGITIYDLSQGTVRFAYFNTQEILEGILSQSYEIWDKVLSILQLMQH